MAPKKRPPVERFMEKTKPAENGCIEWIAYRGENGYGRFYLDGRGWLAHRWSYEYHVGPIPEGLSIDHLCRNRACVNPQHLEPVTTGENVRRGLGPLLASQRAQAVAYCPRGHAYAGENVRVGSNGTRTCVTCKKISGREYYERNRAAVIERSRMWVKSNPERALELGRQGSARYRARVKETVQ